MAKKPTNNSKAGSSLFEGDRIHWISPSEIHNNPLNWRNHPDSQIEALQEAYRSIGFAQPILVNASTRTIIDGHGRLEAAVKENLKAVPVLLLNVSKDEELLLLQNLDSIQAMGSPNAKKIKELIAHNEATLAKLKETNTKALAKLNESLKDHATILAVKKKTPKTIYEVTNRVAKRRELREEDNFELSSRENKAVQEVYRDDATFECDEEWGIPLLLTDPRVLCEKPPTVTFDRTPETNVPDALYCYSTHVKDRPQPGGTLAFFTEDYRFAAVYDRVNEYVQVWKEKQWLNIIEPDYSIYDLDAAGNPQPLPLNLYALYRSRYVIRYCQEVGIRVIPTLRWTSDDRIFDACISTIPTGLPWVACQMRGSLANRTPKEIRQVGECFADAVDITQPQGIIIYGDPDLEPWVREHVPKKIKLIFLQDYTTARQEVRGLNTREYK